MLYCAVLSLVGQDGDISKLVCDSPLTLGDGHVGFRASCEEDNANQMMEKTLSAAGLVEREEEKPVIHLSLLPNPKILCKNSSKKVTPKFLSQMHI